MLTYIIEKQNAKEALRFIVPSDGELIAPGSVGISTHEKYTADSSTFDAGSLTCTAYHGINRAFECFRNFDLAAIRFRITNLPVNTAYNLAVYRHDDNPTINSTTNVVTQTIVSVASKTFTANTLGLNTITLTSPVSLTKGNVYSIIISTAAPAGTDDSLGIADALFKNGYNYVQHYAEASSSQFFAPDPDAQHFGFELLEDATAGSEIDFLSGLDTTSRSYFSLDDYGLQTISANSNNKQIPTGVENGFPVFKYSCNLKNSDGMGLFTRIVNHMNYYSGEYLRYYPNTTERPYLFLNVIPSFSIEGMSAVITLKSAERLIGM